MTKEFCRTILLTGAGFTKNFGGFLADEMWVEIFNDPHVQNSAYTKRMMLDDFDYESIYQKITAGSQILLNGENPEIEKSIIKEAVWSAYQRLDDIIVKWNPYLYSLDVVNLTQLNDFIKRFAGDPWEIGIFFTLNQDLFVELWCQGDGEIYLPWIESTPEKARLAAGALLDQNVITLPTESRLKNGSSELLSTNRLNYIKLHGSFNWISSNGSMQLVIGGEKESRISQEPILRSYFEIFEDALSRPERRLMVIGYGFRDRHINKVIRDCVLEHGLKFYVIDPSSPTEVVNKVRKADDSGVMIKGLSGVFSHKLAQIFSESQPNTVAYETIKKVYFADE